MTEARATTLIAGGRIFCDTALSGGTRNRCRWNERLAPRAAGAVAECGCEHRSKTISVKVRRCEAVPVARLPLTWEPPNKFVIGLVEARRMKWALQRLLSERRIRN